MIPEGDMRATAPPCGRQIMADMSKIKPFTSVMQVYNPILFYNNDFLLGEVNFLFGGREDHLTTTIKTLTLFPFAFLNVTQWKEKTRDHLAVDKIYFQCFRSLCTSFTIRGTLCWYKLLGSLKRSPPTANHREVPNCQHPIRPNDNTVLNPAIWWKRKKKKKQLKHRIYMYN